MGIRINVTIGWGFRYCKYSQDPRFNPKFFEDCDKDYLPAMLELNENLKMTLPDWRQKDFELWTKGQLYGEGEPVTKLTSREILSYSYFNTEENEETRKVITGPIVFTSPEHKDWHRYDDIIDYYTWPGMKDSVKMIVDDSNQPSQIYPYCVYVNRKTGTKPEGCGSVERSLTKMYFDDTKEHRKKWKWEKMPRITCGARSIIEFQRDIVPEPPYIIKLFCQTSNIFKNPLTVYRLKPMVIAYWD
jgi:hypothetical protein